MPSPISETITAAVVGPILGAVADIAGGRSPVLVPSIALVVAGMLGLLAARRYHARSAPEPAAPRVQAPPE